MGADDHLTTDPTGDKRSLFCIECERRVRQSWSYCPDCGTPVVTTEFDH